MEPVSPCLQYQLLTPCHPGSHCENHYFRVRTSTLGPRLIPYLELLNCVIADFYCPVKRVSKKKNNFWKKIQWGQKSFIVIIHNAHQEYGALNTREKSYTSYNEMSVFWPCDVVVLYTSSLPILDGTDLNLVDLLPLICQCCHLCW